MHSEVITCISGYDLATEKDKRDKEWSKQYDNKYFDTDD